MKIPCKISKFKRNDKENWLLLVADNIIILRIQDSETMAIPEIHLNDSYFEKCGVNWNLVFLDKQGYKVIFEDINKGFISKSIAIKFLKQVKLSRRIKRAVKRKYIRI